MAGAWPTSSSALQQCSPRAHARVLSAHHRLLCCCRLPQSVSQLQPQLLARVFGRVSHLLQQLQTQQAAAGDSSSGGEQRALKRPHLAHSQHQQQHPPAAAAAAAAGAAAPEQLVTLLLGAHDAVLLQNGSGLQLAWRLELVRALQQAPWLHEALLAQLLAGLNGSPGADAQVRCRASEQQQCQRACRLCCCCCLAVLAMQLAPTAACCVCAVLGAPALLAQQPWPGVAMTRCSHGRLLALLAAVRPAEVLVLRPQQGALLVPADATAPAFAWRLLLGSSAGGGAGGPCVGGLALAALLLSCTGVASVHQRCCAASFWAGYVCEVQRLGRWVAGERVAASQARCMPSGACQAMHVRKATHAAAVFALHLQMPMALLLRRRQPARRPQQRRRRKAAISSRASRSWLALCLQSCRPCCGPWPRRWPRMLRLRRRRSTERLRTAQAWRLSGQHIRWAGLDVASLRAYLACACAHQSLLLWCWRRRARARWRAGQCAGWRSRQHERQWRGRMTACVASRQRWRAPARRA